MPNVTIKTAEEAEVLNEWLREPTDEEILESHKEDYRLKGMSTREIKERTTAVIDYATGEETTFKACKDKYGEGITKDLLRAKRRINELEPEVKQQIEDIHRGAVIPVAIDTKGHKATRSDKKYVKKNKREDLWVPMPFGLIDNPEFRQFFKGQYLTYAYLRSYIIRQVAPFDHLKLYENYFLKGKLASSWSIGMLADRFDCSPNTIRKHIRRLKNKGCFNVVKVPTKQAWDGQKHNIYIFGTHDGNKKEKFYIDDVFGMPTMPHGQGVQ